MNKNRGQLDRMVVGDEYEHNHVYRVRGFHDFIDPCRFADTKSQK